MVLKSNVRSRPDPFILNEGNYPGILTLHDTNGLTPRNTPIDPTKKTLVLILAGQSLQAGNCPTLYTPVNSSVVSHFNMYDGSEYPITGYILGGYGKVGGAGPGNLNVRLADIFINNAIFDRVILCCTAVGGTLIAQYARGPYYPQYNGNFADRIGVMMGRLAARGIVPGMTGVTFAMDWMIGESDGGQNFTSQADWQAGFAGAMQVASDAGFIGRTFVNLETLFNGVTSATIRAAQAAVVNGTTIFQGGDMDTLTGLTNRQADLTHPNDVGAAAMATLKFNAMHASGAPF